MGKLSFLLVELGAKGKVEIRLRWKQTVLITLLFIHTEVNKRIFKMLSRTSAGIRLISNLVSPDVHACRIPYSIL